MDVTEIFLLHFELELSERLDERHALDVSNSPAQLYARKHTVRI